MYGLIISCSSPTFASFRSTKRDSRSSRFLSVKGEASAAIVLRYTSLSSSPERFLVEEIEQIEQLSQVVIERRAREQYTMNGVQRLESIEDETIVGFH